MTTEQNEQQRPAVRVFDIPAGASTEEAAKMIEENNHAGYYMVSAIPWPGVGARVFSRQQMKPGGEGESPERRQEDTAAEAIIRKYPKLSAGKLADKLAEHGIVRGAVWVGFRRKTLERAAIAATVRLEA